MNLSLRITYHSLVMCGSEAFAPLGTAAFEHELAALGAHANAEAMSLGAPAIVGLKSPLHGLHLSISVSAEKGKAIGSTGCCQGGLKSQVIERRLLRIMRDHPRTSHRSPLAQERV